VQDENKEGLLSVISPKLRGDQCNLLYIINVLLLKKISHFSKSKKIRKEEISISKYCI